MAIQRAYSDGTASLTAGSAIVRGTDTAWALRLVNGGLFTWGGRAIPIASVQSNTELTLEYASPVTYIGGYAIDLHSAEAASSLGASRRLAELISSLNGLSPLGTELATAKTEAEMRAILKAIGPDGGAMSRVRFDEGTILQDQISNGKRRAYWIVAGDRLELVNQGNNQHVVIFDLTEGPLWAGLHKMWHANNDGPDSGLDADLLDGQHGAFFRDFANATGQVQPAQQVIRPDLQAGVGAVAIGVWIGNPTVAYSATTLRAIGSEIDDNVAPGNRYYGGGTWMIKGFVGRDANGRAVHEWQRVS